MTLRLTDSALSYGMTTGAQGRAPSAAFAARVTVTTPAPESDRGPNRPSREGSPQARSHRLPRGGHAIAAFELRRAIRHISVVPKDDSLGHVVRTAPPKSIRPDVYQDQRTMLWVEREVVIAFAGMAAEGHFVGRYNHVGASSDFKAAVDLASHFMGLDEVLTKYLDYMLARTKSGSCRLAGRRVVASRLPRQSYSGSPHLVDPPWRRPWISRSLTSWTRTPAMPRSSRGSIPTAWRARVVILRTA